MILKEFPNLHLTRQRFNGLAKPGLEDLRPNVLLTVDSGAVHRTDLRSPFSLFANLKGESWVSVGGKRRLVGNNHFLVLNSGQQFDLEIEGNLPTETFIIHFNQVFFEDCYTSLAVAASKRLNGVGETEVGGFYNHLREQPEQLAQLFQQLKNQAVLEGGEADFDDLMVELIDGLALLDEQVQLRIARLPMARASVRTELFKRMAQSKDFILSNLDQSLDLAALCENAAMSKFHFLRTFKEVVGLTPRQYLKSQRMKKAAGLLRHSKLKLVEISDEVGFECPNSFIRSFSKYAGIPPLKFRQISK